jgi:MFS family permease
MASVCMYVSIVGTTYAYGVYSELLKTNLGFSQNGLDIIASVGNTGLYLSLIAGLLLENFGLKFVVMGGGFLIFIGFLYIYLAVKGVIAANIVSVSIFFFLSQFGVCCHVSSAITYCIRLFPSNKRGAAVGLGKGYFGLSSAVLGDVAGGYFYKYTSTFILLIDIIIHIIIIYKWKIKINPKMYILKETEIRYYRNKSESHLRMWRSCKSFRTTQAYGNYKETH